MSEAVRKEYHITFSIWTASFKCYSPVTIVSKVWNSPNILVCF